MNRRWSGPFALILALGASSGCVKNDLGTACKLIAPNTAGGTSEFTVPPGTTNDYISTGVPDCEDFHCVDTAGDLDAAGADATGYCTRRCNADEECRGGVDDSLVCRDLVLDQQFIEQLRIVLGPDEFEAVFGEIQNDTYCARP